MRLKKTEAGAQPSSPEKPMPSKIADATEQPVVFHAPRRKVLGMGVGVGLGMTGVAANAAKPPKSQRPQPGDLIVVRFGDAAGQSVKPADVPAGAELLQVLVKEPKEGIVRDGSRLNGINLVRIDAEKLDDETKNYMVEGVIAYSSVCTHQGCDLTQWVPETTTFKCFCHHSEFDAAQNGVPINGPAKRRLAILPIALNDNKEFVVTEKFTGRVGFK